MAGEIENGLGSTEEAAKRDAVRAEAERLGKDAAALGRALQDAIDARTRAKPTETILIALGVGWLHGIPSVALRYSITQGPRQSLFNQYSGVCRIFVGRALQREPLIVYEDGLQTRDFVHIHDVVAANMRVLESDDANFQAFNVGSGKPTTVLEYANLVRKKLSSDVEISLSGEYRRGDNRNSVSKVDKLKRLGWSPKHDLSTILDDFLAWVESIGGVPAQIQDAYGAMRRAGVVLQATNGR